MYTIIRAKHGERASIQENVSFSIASRLSRTLRQQGWTSMLWHARLTALASQDGESLILFRREEDPTEFVRTEVVSGGYTSEKTVSELEVDEEIDGIKSLDSFWLVEETFAGTVLISEDREKIIMFRLKHPKEPGQLDQNTVSIGQTD